MSVDYVFRCQITNAIQFVLHFTQNKQPGQDIKLLAQHLEMICFHSGPPDLFAYQARYRLFLDILRLDFDTDPNATPAVLSTLETDSNALKSSLPSQNTFAGHLIEEWTNGSTIGTETDTKDTIWSFLYQRLHTTAQFISDRNRQDDSNDIRTSYIVLFRQVFRLYPDDNFQKNADRLARQMESACHNASIHSCIDSADAIRRRWNSDLFLSIYSRRCAAVAVNIDPSRSVARTFGIPMVKLLIANEVTLEQIGQMTEMELCPQASNRETTALEIRRQQRIETRSSSLFRCKRCGARECEYSEHQTRAADEPSDLFITCLRCDHRFKR
jgi:DNA-directed RNA polymerase subunit M/transcription elongation factor TFIIS